MFQADFLQRYKVIGQLTATFVHGSIGALQTGRKTGARGPDGHVQTGGGQTDGPRMRDMGTETGKEAGQNGQTAGCNRSSQVHLHLSQFVQFDVRLQFPKANF